MLAPAPRPSRAQGADRTQCGATPPPRLQEWQKSKVTTILAGTGRVNALRVLAERRRSAALGPVGT